jgi:hypothetical protein
MTLIKRCHKATFAQPQHFAEAYVHCKVNQMTLGIAGSIAPKKPKSELGLGLFELSQNVQQQEPLRAW